MRTEPERTEIRVAYDGGRESGRAVDLSGEEVTPDAVVAAIRSNGSSVTVDCPEPSALHEDVGVVRPGMDVSLRRLLATVARRRGYESTRADELAAVREELSNLSPPPVDTEAARRRVARAGRAEAELDERVAALRGEIRALADRDVDAATERDELASVIEELSGVRTRRIAAEQALSSAREEGRNARDRRERRLQLQDRERNIERAVRRELANAVYDEFTAAVREVPGSARLGSDVTAFDGESITAALGVVRLSAMRAPVVLSCDRFSSPTVAARRLGVPVVTV